MNQKFFYLVLVCFFAAFTACKNESKPAATEQTATPVAAPETAPATDAGTMSAAAAAAGTATPPPAEPAQNAKGVWHFTCPKGCAGGAGATGACPKCGGQLTHNTAYHAQ